MGVRASIAGLFRWKGKPLTSTGYSYVEESTSVDPTDTFGGAPQLTAKFISVPGDKSWRNKVIELADNSRSRGRVSGIVRTPAGNGLETTIQADGRTALLNAEKQAQPFVGTLDAAFRYYLGLCGLTTQITIAPRAGDSSVVLRGWNGNVYDFVRMLLVVYRLEMTEVGDEIVIRELRERVALRLRDTSAPQWSLDSSSIAKQVEGYYYNNVQKTNSLFYPEGGWNNDVQVYQVDAGATITFDIPVNVTLTSVQQPSVVASVDRNYTASSVYSVTGNDGLVIPPAQWLNGGGSVSVEILEDLATIRVTLVGSTETRYAPYRLAMPSGPSNVYSSLRLVGSGVFFSEQTELIYTGANEELATQDVGASIKIPFVNTLSDLYDLAIWAVARWCGPIQKLTLTTTGIQRKGERNAYRYPTIREFNAANLGQSIAQFNVTWAGKSIRDFNEYWDATVVNEFANQAFGNMAGARLLDDGQWYRVRSSTTDADFALQLERDTTIRDFNTRYENMTIAQFNQFWEGDQLADFNVRPLREGL